MYPRVFEQLCRKNKKELCCLNENGKLVVGGDVVAIFCSWGKRV